MYSNAKPPQNVVKRNLCVGDDNFARFIEEKYPYVDKSLLVRDIIDDPAPVKIIIQRRRSGKSLNLRMLESFFARVEQPNSVNLFKDLKIWQAGQRYQREHQQYPTIFLNFKDLNCRNLDDIYPSMQKILSKLYSQHKKCLFAKLFNEGNYPQEKELYEAIIERKASESETMDALANLMKYLRQAYNKKCVLLIDEYDTPIIKSIEKNCYQETVKLVKALLTPALDANPNLYQAIIVGITRVPNDALSSKLPGMQVYSVLTDIKYSPYFGFTAEEVKQILPEKLEYKFNEMTNWYGGYQVGNLRLYNIWSVACFINDNLERAMSEELFKSYWIEKGPDSKVMIGLLADNIDSIQTDICQLLQNKSIRQCIDEQAIYANPHKNILNPWNFLLFSGYLSISKIVTKLENGRAICDLVIPNQELYILFYGIAKHKQWIEKSDSLQFQAPIEIANDLAEFEPLRITIDNNH